MGILYKIKTSQNWTIQLNKNKAYRQVYVVSRLSLETPPRTIPHPLTLASRVSDPRSNLALRAVTNLLVSGALTGMYSEFKVTIMSNV